MKSFVKFQTLFNTPEERSIQFLTKRYSDSFYLESIIRELIGQTINEDTVKGKRVLLKPNWVSHFKKPGDEVCLHTHHSVTIAMLKVLLGFKPKNILIGDAPIQGCKWDKICDSTFLNSVEELERKHSIPIEINDFRRRVFNTSDFSLIVEKNQSSDYTIFDLGEGSFLEPITEPKRNLFRVAHYDHRRLSESHRKGIHKYCITSKIFSSDLIISLPKIKTHQKTGITGALKNLVGINGDKDFLPHHRKGSIIERGDSFQKPSVIRNLSESIIDISNRNIGNWSFKILQKLGLITWGLSRPGIYDQIGAGWYGNDTTWRMVLDINKIMLLGLPDGKLSGSSQRMVYSLSDAIICGQGNGPLDPEPLPLGLLSFSDNSALNDYLYAILFGYDPWKLELIKNAFNIFEKDFSEIYVDNKKVTKDILKILSIEAKPPSGWIGYI